MIDKDVFCSSPWLHLRIGYTGRFFPCRWIRKKVYDKLTPELCIQKNGLLDYFNSAPMIELRQNLLNGIKSEGCGDCYYQDSFGKASGRKKQLFRSDLANKEEIEKSKHFPLFQYSQNNCGKTNSFPIDLQIDLENTCNGACIMCFPGESSRLKTDYVKLHKIEPMLFENPREFECWATNSDLVKKFVSELKQIPNIEYIHFLGGETLYVESFYMICEAMISSGHAKNIIIGATTNGTVYSPRLENIVKEFKGFHLGLSIESTTILNDYVRYPAQIDTVLETFSKFLTLRENCQTLHLTLRITPNIFTIYHFDQLLQYMISNNITAESCNILRTPSVLRMELLPENLKQQAIDKITACLKTNNIQRVQSVVDTRNPALLNDVISNVAYGYIDFLTNMKTPENVEEERHNLVKFLSAFESIRGNSILDYVPEYANFLCTKYGYLQMCTRLTK
jgi:MoaA/NifB/PqqE/SkfB family radical SAM enzyme